MRLVLDTSALVAGFRSSTGASREILRLAFRRKVTLLVSVGLFVEYEAVLKRPEHLKAAALTEAKVGKALDAMAAFVEQVETYFLWRPRLRDPGDDMVLEAAVNGRADAIVTFNIRDFAMVLPEFGIPVLRPGDVLRKL